jgi:hypothetical protein
VKGPSLVIRLPLEGPPAVCLDALNDGEGARVSDWVTAAHPGYGELGARAQELADEADA